MSEFRPLRFNDASIRANELVANTKLGIGTHSQGHPLAIAKAGTVYTSISDTSAGTDAKHWWTAVSGNQMTHYLANDLNNASQPYMKINRSGHTVDSITFDFGKVGIGTASPVSTLQVGDGNTTPTTGDASGSISVAGTGATKSNGGKPGLYHRALIGLGLWSDAHMSFEVNGYDGGQTEAMRILTSGNVGVGTTNPGQKLSIYTGSTSTPALSFDRYSSGNYRTDIYQNSYGPDFRVGYGAYTPESILYLKRMSDGTKEVDIKGSVWISGNLQLANAGADYAFHVKKFTSSVNVANLTLDFDLNSQHRGGIVKVWLTSGVSGQATVATWSRKVIAFSWKNNPDLAQTTIEDEEGNSGNAITISMPSNGTLRVQGSMYSSFSYPMMEVEVTYAGGVRA